MFEYCEHDISALLDKVRTPFSESEIKSLVFQLLSAVAYLHEHWIIHRGLSFFRQWMVICTFYVLMTSPVFWG